MIPGHHEAPMAGTRHSADADLRAWNATITNPATTVESLTDVAYTLVELARRHERARLHLGSRKDAPAPVLRVLAADPSSNVRRAVAGHTRTPPVFLTELADDVVPAVRAAVAGNTSTPASTLAAMAHTATDAHTVLWHLANNASCTSETLEAVLDNEAVDDALAQRLLIHPGLRQDSIERIAAGGLPDAARAAGQILAAPPRPVMSL